MLSFNSILADLPVNSIIRLEDSRGDSTVLEKWSDDDFYAVGSDTSYDLLLVTIMSNDSAGFLVVYDPSKIGFIGGFELTNA